MEFSPRRSRARRILRTLGASIVVVGVAGSAGCGGSDDPGAEARRPNPTVVVPPGALVSKVGVASVDVSAIDNDFQPRYLEVTAGTKVTFNNKGRNPHNVVPVPEDAFTGVSQGDFQPGSFHIVTFAEPGDYLYFCSIHGTATNGQNGVVRVVAAT